MLYEVITRFTWAEIGRAMRGGKGSGRATVRARREGVVRIAQEKGLVEIRVVNLVITSYSIHYTKLYELLEVRPPGKASMAGDAWLRGLSGSVDVVLGPGA